MTTNRRARPRISWNTAVMVLEIIEAGLRWSSRLAVFAGLLIAAISAAAPTTAQTIELATTGAAVAAAGLLVGIPAVALRAWLGDIDDED